MDGLVESGLLLYIARNGNRLLLGRRFSSDNSSSENCTLMLIYTKHVKAVPRRKHSSPESFSL